MYNGIGLPTPRGSGTNGYVQRNLSLVRGRRGERPDYKGEEELRRLEAALVKRPNPDILDHERKRRVELRCLELEEMMEEQGYEEQQIQEKVATFRLMLLEKDVNPGGKEETPGQRPMVTETHQLAELNEKKNERLRAAFGISDSYVDGSSFDPQRRAREAKQAVPEPPKPYRSPTPKSKRKSKDKKRKRSRSTTPAPKSRRAHRSTSADSASSSDTSRSRNRQFDLVPLRKGAAQGQNYLPLLRSLLSNMRTPHVPLQQSHPVRSQLTPHLRSPQPGVVHHLSLLRNLPDLLPQRAVHHPLSLPKFLGMSAPLLKVLNPHQLLGPAERFLLHPHLRIVHMAEQSGINLILIPHLIERGDPVVLPLRGDDLDLEPPLREVILDPVPLSGVGHGLLRGGENLEARRGVAGLDLRGQAGPGVEIPREEEGLGQQGEEGHTLDLQPLGADPVLGHQLEGAGLVLEHLLDADHDPEHLPGVGLGLEHLLVGAGLGLEHLLGVDLGPDHQFEGGPEVDPQLGEVAGHTQEHQPGEVAGHAPEHQPGEVAGHALEHQPGEVAGHALEHQHDEDLAAEVWVDVEDLTLEHHKEEDDPAHHQRGRTNLEPLRGGADPTQAWK
ncbi:hypothetical protein NN561_018488 [Cricetulus griseus]